MLPTSPRLVITRPVSDSGLGSNLASLAGALRVAEALSGTLVVDWRDRTHLHDKSLNYFTEFFEPVAELCGVPVLYAPTAALETSTPAVLAPAAAARVLEAPERCPDGDIELRLFHGLDRIARSRARANREFLRETYSQIALRADVQAVLDGWAERYLDGFVVGVHVRTGNGEFAPGSGEPRRVDAALLRDEARLLHAIERAIEGFRRGASAADARRVVFYASDSAQMAATLSRLEGAVTRRTVFPPAGVGHKYTQPEEDGFSDRDAALDAVVDMFLLTRCDALIYSKSVFSTYARVVRNDFDGRAVQLANLLDSRLSLRRARALAGGVWRRRPTLRRLLRL